MPLFDPVDTADVSAIMGPPSWGLSALDVEGKFRAAACCADADAMAVVGVSTAARALCHSSALNLSARCRQVCFENA